MSEIKVDTLTGKTSDGNITVTSEGGAATMQLQQGLAKAWINFNGNGTIASRDSFNSASLVDNGTGDYTNNFTNAMGNANFSAMVASGDVSGNKSTRDEEVYQITTGLVKYFIYHTNAELARDEDYIGGTVHGDLA